jgi:hypothetical protein
MADLNPETRRRAPLFVKRCRGTAIDGRGFKIPFDDDLQTLTIARKIKASL